MITARTKLAITATGALLLLLGVQTCRLAEANERARDNAFRADSAEAAADTSRDVTPQLAKLIGDSVRASELRILQVTPKRDEIDAALNRTTETAATLTAEFRGLRQLVAESTAPTTEDSAGTRTGTFTLREPPVTIAATATLPSPPALGKLVVDSLDVDPAPIGVRVQCGQAVGGVRPASLLVTTPEWLTVTIDSVRSDPNVCNPEPEECRIPIIRTRCPTRTEVLIGSTIIGVGAGAYGAHRLSRKD